MAMYSADPRASITRLNNNNYAMWKFKLEMILSRDELWDIVMADRPTDADEQWRKKDRSAMAAISLSVEDDQLIHLRNLKTAKEMWDSLRRIHERKNLSSRLYLLRKLYKIKYEHGTDMRAFLNNVLEMIEKLRAIGEEIKDNHVAALLLSSLPESYEALITALEARSDSDISLELVKEKLMDEATRKEEQHMNVKHDAEAVLSIKRDYGNRSRESRICYHCNKQGHLKRDCALFKGQSYKAKWTENEQISNGESKSGAHESYERERSGYRAKWTGFIASSNNDTKSGMHNTQHEDFCFGTTSIQNQESWYVDSGATAHMTCDRNFFESLSCSEKRDSVVLADGSRVRISGIGYGYLCCVAGPNESNKIKLTDVLYVPDLKGSLLSVKRLTSLGYGVHFFNDTCEIAKNGIIISKAKLDSELYQLQCGNLAMETIIDKHTNCIHMWHRKLGHRDPNAILRLHNQAMAKGIKLVDCKEKLRCVTCIRGKMTKKPFPKQSQNRATRPYDLIHTDVCGPMETETPGGKRYFVIFVDDYSRYTEVYLLRNKSEVQEKLQFYLAKGNSKFNRKPLTLRSDGGGEYTSYKIEEYLNKEGIKRQITVPYSPEQNGVAERKNRSILEMTKCMLLDSGFSNKYWGEAVVTAVYIQNRVPHSACEATPYEMWNNKIPEIGHMEVFGSTAYIYVPKEKRTKFDDTAIKGKLVGYSEESKGYRILIPGTNRVIISRSVIFDKIETQKNEMKKDTIIPDKNSEIEIAVIESKILQKTEEDAQKPTQLRRSERINFGIPAQKFSYGARLQLASQPESWHELQDLSNIEKERWNQAIEEEMISLARNETWDLVELPKGKTTIGCKWVFKIKHDANGDINKYKARLVAKGFSQKYGIDYNSVFAPVVRYTTVRTLLTIAAQRSMKTCHMDVCSAFLNGELLEEIFMDQPEGQIKPGNEKLVCKLNKCIYGLKQSAKAWNDKISELLIREGFKRGLADECLYSKIEGATRTYILIYVDDLLICSDSDTSLDQIKHVLRESFEMKDLGEIKLYLGIHIEKDEEGNYNIHQSDKIQEQLIKFKLDNANSARTPMENGYMKEVGQQKLTDTEINLYREGVGALLYMSTITRPDICAPVSFLGRKVSNPSVGDWRAMKRLFRYLKGTMNKKLCLSSTGNGIVHGFADADWAEDPSDRKSTSGYAFVLGSSLISWTSKKQSCIALSTTEAEYMALALASQEALWLRQLMTDLNEEQINSTIIHEDNQSCIKLASNSKHSGRTKHIDIRYRFVKDLQEHGTISLVYCPSDNMLADILTKPLSGTRHHELVQKLGLTDHVSCVGVLKNPT